MSRLESAFQRLVIAALRAAPGGGYAWKISGCVNAPDLIAGNAASPAFYIELKSVERIESRPLNKKVRAT